VDGHKDEPETLETQTPGKPPLCTCVEDPFSGLPFELRLRPRNTILPGSSSKIQVFDWDCGGYSRFGYLHTDGGQDGKRKRANEHEITEAIIVAWCMKQVTVNDTVSNKFKMLSLES